MPNGSTICHLYVVYHSCVIQVIIETTFETVIHSIKLTFSREKRDAKRDRRSRTSRWQPEHESDQEASESAVWEDKDLSWNDVLQDNGRGQVSDVYLNTTTDLHTISVHTISTCSTGVNYSEMILKHSPCISLSRAAEQEFGTSSDRNQTAHRCHTVAPATTAGATNGVFDKTPGRTHHFRSHTGSYQCIQKKSARCRRG